MIVYEGFGDLFDCSSHTVTCTTNCAGAMGKGLAKEFKERVPGLYDYYLSQFPRTNRPDPMLVNELRVFRVPDGRQVLLFPTKLHWANPSQLSWIDENLAKVARTYRELGIGSLALPKLGCTNGGLNYEDVRPLIYRHFNDHPLEVEILLR